MIRKHSTRLSQEHDEPEDGQEQHRTAAHDYPEMGTILDDRPDPGGQITVVGMRKTAAAYGTDEDSRREDYNGGEGDLGMNWAEPGEQDWVHEHLGPQEAAPPPAYDMMPGSPVMARLAQIEEARQLLGARHHATDINGTHVDDAGDAPAHGTVPRAGAPDAYDARSTEGQGDDRWNQPLPGVSKEDSNGATVGMYPEGISAGGGPGISVGPVTAVAEWERHPDLMDVHGRMVTRDELLRHMQEGHGMPPGHPLGRESDRTLRLVHTVRHSRGDQHIDSSDDDDDGYAYSRQHEYEPLQRPYEDDPDEGTAATYHAHEGPIDPVFGAKTAGMTRREFHDLRRHMIDEHGFDIENPDYAEPRYLTEDHEADHSHNSPDHTHDTDYEFNPYWDEHDTAGGYHEFTGLRREARVPWTGKERGQLHRWQEAPTATWGDFVPSSDFPLLDPGEHVRHPEAEIPSGEGDGLGPVEAASDAQWEAHLRREHGWGDSQVSNVRGRGDRLGDMHDALHSGGLADHKHQDGPEQAREEAREHSLNNMFGRDITENGPAMRSPGGYPLALPGNGGHAGEDPMIGIIRSRQVNPPTHPDEWEQKDPARFRRMMSALNVHVRIDGKPLVHDHDDPDNSLDADGDSPQDNPQGRKVPDGKSSQATGDDSLDSPQDSPQDESQPFDPDDPMSDPGNWPQAGADVNERGRAYTQGRDDGKVTRTGQPAAFSPDDGDSGGGGDQDSDPDGGDQPDNDDTPFSKDGALAMFTAAAVSPAFRFEFTAAWNDVVAKAKRIRAEGHVRIVHASAGMVIGEVRGDHDTYETGIQRPVGKRQTIQHWACGCPWASFHQSKTAARRGAGGYAGRPCSHVMALQFEAQARGMFGRSFGADAEAPSWAPQSVVVKSWPPYEGEPHRGRWREEWRAPLARRRAGAEKPYLRQPDDEMLTAHLVHHHGLPADSVADAMEAGASGAYWRKWHEGEHRNSTALTHQHDEERGIPGEHRWPNLFEPETGFRVDDYGGQESGWAPAGSYGGVYHEKLKPMMPHWSALGAPERRATAALLRAGEDPEEVGALRLLAGLRAEADYGYRREDRDRSVVERHMEEHLRRQRSGRGWETEMIPNPRFVASPELPEGGVTHLMRGYMNGKPAGVVAAGASNNMQAWKVHNLHVSPGFEGHDVAGALMDSFYDHVKAAGGRWVNHGIKTQSDENLWRSYAEPHPEMNIHNVPPSEDHSEGWNSYFRPSRVHQDMVRNTSNFPGTSPKPDWTSNERLNRNTDDRWTRARGLPVTPVKGEWPEKPVNGFHEPHHTGEQFPSRGPWAPNGLDHNENPFQWNRQPVQRATADLARSDKMVARHLETAHGGDHYAAHNMGISLARYHDKLHEWDVDGVNAKHRHEPGEAPDPGFLPDIRLVESRRVTADQANAPWGSDNTSQHPPQKPYGATSPPNPDQDPGSYGPLAAPDPANWGGIDESSAYQMPMSNTAVHQVLAPGAPRPMPGDLHWPGTEGWQAEDQGTFGYTDHANTAGPSTAMSPRDPEGIRMEEARGYFRAHRPGDSGESHYDTALRDAQDQASASGRDSLVIPMGGRPDGHPAIWVTNQYSHGNMASHYRVSPEGAWSRLLHGFDDGYTRLPGTPRPRNLSEAADYDQARYEHPPEEEIPGSAVYRSHDGPIDPVFGARAELKDDPEPALPSTTGDDLEATAAADGTMGGGDAGTGEGQGAPLDTAALGEFGASVRAGFRQMFAGTPMGDLSRETSPQAQQPSPVGQEPGMGSGDDYMSPEDPSIQTVGNQQWSGGGADSDEGAVEPGQPQGSIDDIVASFQRSAAAKGYAGDSPVGHGDGDIAVAARQYLEKTADVLPKAEADELVREGRGQRARNLDLLRLEGTHYEESDDDRADEAEDSLLWI